MHFLHNYNPDPVLLQIGRITIYWYGLLMLIAILSGIFITIKLAKRYRIEPDKIWDLAFWLVIGALVGARLYHVALEFGYYFNNPGQIIKIWQGGIAIHGAWLGGFVALFFWCKKNKEQMLKWLDLLSPGLILGQAIGRWGNYFNQELFGKPTNLPWSIPIDPANRPVGYEQFTYFHPTFWYESFANLIIFFILLRIFAKKKFEGQVFWHYLLFYSLVRAGLESLRIDNTLTIAGMRWPQLFSVIVALVALVVLIKSFWRLHGDKFRS